MQQSSYRRWITLAIISFSGGVSFDLAYLRYIYQIPMAKFMGFSNTEIGLIMSTFGVAAIILYAPSGVIADKFSHRKMITSAMIITGLLGLLMMTYPPLWVMLCIQVAFAITTILMLWSVSIKAASLLGDHSEQGKIMGWMEGLRGVGVMSLAVFTMWVFSRFAPDDSNSLRKPSQIMVDRAVTVPRGKVGTVFGRLDHRTLSVVDVALARFLGLGERVA